MKRFSARAISAAVLLAVFTCLLLIPAGKKPAFAYSTDPAFTATDFATGFATNGTDIGPTGLAFDSSDNLFVMDSETGFLYKFGPAGGVASTATQVNTTRIDGFPAGITFTRDGRLYLARQSAGDVVELNPADGTIIRPVATGICSATGIATDPLSGDLFVSEGCGPIVRISNFASGPGTKSVYASPGAADGLTFGPDGTLYAALPATSGGSNSVIQIAGTNTSSPAAVTPIATVPLADGIAVSAGSKPSQPAFLLRPTQTGPAP
jgi:sugar lactone lactonase YvrE